MNQDQIQQLKKHIEAEIYETEKKIKKYKDLCKPIAPENAIGRVSRMDAIQNKSVVEAALRKAEKKMKNLIYIHGSSSNNIGLCIKCRKNIPYKRLMIMPESKLCVNCAQ